MGVLSKKRQYRLLTVADGGSLYALQNKGNLTHVEELYNPNHYFEEVHIIVFDKRDLTVPLSSVFKVHYLRHLPFGKLGLALSLPLLIIQLIYILKQHKIDVVRSRNAYLAGLLGALCGKMLRIPTVLSLGGDNRLVQQLMGHYYFNSQFLSYKIEAFSLKHATHVIAINDFTKQYAIRLGVSPEATSIVPHRIHIDPAHYQYDTSKARSELRLPGHSPIVLVIGRLEKDKQVDVAIEVIPLVKKKFPDVKFIFIGDGRLREMLRTRVEQMQVQANAIFTGFQPREKIIKYLAAASVVCIPMSGFVIYEAAASKKPIVAFDVEWHAEFVKHKKTGLLVSNRDVGALANALCSVLKDPLLAVNMGENAHRQLITQFDRQHIAQQEIDVYESLLKEYVLHEA